QKYLSEIMRDIDDANKLGIQGTPTWFINGTKISGFIPHYQFVEAINNYLNSNN
ncbi:DsbA family protein, partial [Patescibacteria group bacterium]